MNNQLTFEAELSARSVLEDLLELVEKHDGFHFNLGDFYDVVNELDESLRLFNSVQTNQRNIKQFNHLLEITFRHFVEIFKVVGFQDEPFFFAFKRFISFFLLVLKESGNHRRFDDVHDTFYSNFPSLFFSTVRDAHINPEEEIYAAYALAHSRPVEIHDRYGAPIDYRTNNIAELESFIENAPIEILRDGYLDIYCNDFIVKTVQWLGNISRYRTIEQEFYMRISVHVDNDEPSASKLLQPLWLFVSAIEGVKGTTVQIEDISTGSLDAKIEIRMKDLVAKEQVKTVLEAGFQSSRDEPIVDGEVTLADSVVNVAPALEQLDIDATRQDLEVQKLLLEIEQLPSVEEVQAGRDLDTERKKLEIELLKSQIGLNNTLQMKELSGMVRQGAFIVDELRFEINGIPCLLKKDGVISVITTNLDGIV